MSGGVWAVLVEYHTPTGGSDNLYGTFRSRTAAERFKAEIYAWDKSRGDDGSDVTSCTARVLTVTKPLLEYVQEDVERMPVPMPLPRHPGLDSLRGSQS